MALPLSTPMEFPMAPVVPLAPAPATSLAAARGWTHRWKTVFGKGMSVLTVDGKEYMIGVQIAQLLKRETFNLYRSLKIKGIDVVRAENEQVDYLVNCNSIKRGTHSVTLVPLDDGLTFVLGALGTGSGSDERRRTEGRGPRGGKKLKRSMDEMSAAGDESSGGDSPVSKEKNARNDQWEPKSSRNASRTQLRKSLSLSGSDSEMSQLLKAELELQVQLPASSISGPSHWPAPQHQPQASCASAAAEEARGPWHMLLLTASAEYAQL